MGHFTFQVFFFSKTVFHLLWVTSYKQQFVYMHKLFVRIIQIWNFYIYFWCMYIYLISLTTDVTIMYPEWSRITNNNLKRYKCFILQVWLLIWQAWVLLKHICRITSAPHRLQYRNEKKIQNDPEKDLDYLRWLISLTLITWMLIMVNCK